MDDSILDNIEGIVAAADKILGVGMDGSVQPVANYAALVAPLCAYLKQLEQRVKALENNT